MPRHVGYYRMLPIYYFANKYKQFAADIYKAMDGWLLIFFYLEIREFEYPCLCQYCLIVFFFNSYLNYIVWIFKSEPTYLLFHMYIFRNTLRRILSTAKQRVRLRIYNIRCVLKTKLKHNISK